MNYEMTIRIVVAFHIHPSVVSSLKRNMGFGAPERSSLLYIGSIQHCCAANALLQSRLEIMIHILLVVAIFYHNGSSLFPLIHLVLIILFPHVVVSCGL